MAGNTILVVDDEQRMRKLVRDFLTKQNFRVLEAADGEEVKAVTFDVSKELIQSIHGGTVEAKDIPEKAENLYILYTLTDEAETTADSETAETTSESESTSEAES